MTMSLDSGLGQVVSLEEDAHNGSGLHSEIRKTSTGSSSVKEENMVQTTPSTDGRWFHMQSTELTESAKRDLKVLQLRNFINPKRFYKSSDHKKRSLPKVFQVGTVIEGAHEFKSHRIVKKARQSELLDELVVANPALRSYAKRTYESIRAKKSSGGKGWYGRTQGKKTQNKTRGF